MNSISEAEAGGFRTPRLRSRRLRLPFAMIAPAVAMVDLAILLLSALASTFIYNRLVWETAGDLATGSATGVAAFSYFALMAAYRGNYQIDNLSKLRRQIRELTVVWALVCLFLLGVAFLLKLGPVVSRGTTICFFVLAWSGLLAWRWWLASALDLTRDRGVFAGKGIVVVADDSLTEARVADLQRSGFRTKAVVIVADQSCLREVAGRVLQATVDDPTVDSVFMSLAWSRADRIKALVSELAIVPLAVRLLPDPGVAAFIDKPAIQKGKVWAAELQRTPLTRVERAAKRAIDVFLSLLTGLVCLPLLAIVAVLIKLDSKGPVIFTQTRNGFNNRVFRIFKFRSLTASEDGPVIQQVTRDDQRVTRIGRLLRQSSIDELPQLLNVLKGDMSLVGPRPHAAAHNFQYAPTITNYAFRHHVKPGLTGWAQVNGLRGETSTLDLMQQRVDLDTWYINNWSLLLDVKIIWLTIFQIVTRVEHA